MRTRPGDHWHTRAYRSQHAPIGYLFFQDNPRIHQQRSTVNASPLWGIRSGTAKHGVGPGSRLFRERVKWRRHMTGYRFKHMLRQRRNPYVYYAGRYAND
ncbi:hypothetical protein HOU02_gp557 [Caulobacter phage CcrBL9]|uniref:Uncharacterized protein n=1 Tax=Caulobacter phage CcrBL9 TaxID=2283270 RepID=A0A385EEI3_9CAUD|nr:hypothetical protein HOU02_gp557 [Caulobacter phage CcrBL9]AXQ69168.1 hypothetical protein CcrBL9_gp144 [Caulobacter phage CcrBL9]